MIVTHKISLDMVNAGGMPRIEAVQDDRYTRNVELTLTADGEPWEIPQGITVAVRYRKSDGIVGQYDALPDGTQAWSASGNVLTVALAPQTLTMPGPVTMAVSFLDGDREIHTFGFLVSVQANAGASTGESEPYFYVRGFLPQPEISAAGQFLQITGVNDQGSVVQMTAVDAPNWVDLDEKPLVSVNLGDTLTWDGNTEGRVSWERTGYGWVFYKVSTACPERGDLVNGATVGFATGTPAVISGTNIYNLGEKSAYISAYVYFVHPEDAADLGMEAGTYFRKSDSQGLIVTRVTVSGYSFSREQLDPEILPGVAVLYTDDTGYLYCNSYTGDSAKRLTRLELRRIVMSGQTFLLCADLGSGLTAYTPVMALFPEQETYGAVRDLTAGQDYFTAEYSAD